MPTTFFRAALCLFLVAGCAPVAEDPITEIVVTDDATGIENTVETAGRDGLVEREPDTCKLSDYAELSGQPSSAVAAFGVTRDYRIVGPTDIVTQEYNPQRVNFYVNGAGVIQRIACG